MDAKPVDTGVWPVIRKLVQRVDESLSEDPVASNVLKDLASALSTVARLELQAQDSGSKRDAPGRPPKDPGGDFGFSIEAAAEALTADQEDGL